MRPTAPEHVPPRAPTPQLQRRHAVSLKRRPVGGHVAVSVGSMSLRPRPDRAMLRSMAHGAPRRVLASVPPATSRRAGGPRAARAATRRIAMVAFPDVQIL